MLSSNIVLGYALATLTAIFIIWFFKKLTSTQV